MDLMIRLINRFSENSLNLKRQFLNLTGGGVVITRITALEARLKPFVLRADFL
jgi:hypothetical protein